MALTVAALTTVLQVKALATGADELPGASHDGLIEFLIEGVSSRMAQYIGRTLERKTSTLEKYVGHGGQWLKLKRRPVVSIAQILDGGSVVPATDYILESDIGLVYREGGWGGGSLETPGLALGEPHPNAVKFNLEVTYDSGYITPNQTSLGARTLPYDLELACVRLVFGLYKTRGKEGISRESFEGLSLDFDKFPEEIRAILDKYVDIYAG